LLSKLAIFLAAFDRKASCQVYRTPNKLKRALSNSGLSALRLYEFDERVERLCGIGRLHPRLTKLSDQLGLALARDLSIARKGCKDRLVAQVLAPCLELLRRATDTFAKLGQRLPERMGVCRRKAGACERLPENIAEGRCIGPV
jgi:hypothetical protein